MTSAKTHREPGPRRIRAAPLDAPPIAAEHGGRNELAGGVRLEREHPRAAEVRRARRAARNNWRGDDRPAKDDAISRLRCSFSLCTSMVPVDVGLVCSNNVLRFRRWCAALRRRMAPPVMDRLLSYTRATWTCRNGTVTLYSDHRLEPRSSPCPSTAWRRRWAPLPSIRKQSPSCSRRCSERWPSRSPPSWDGASASRAHQATAGCLTLALCTPRTYSSALWSHAPSAFFAICAACLALRGPCANAVPPHAPCRLLFFSGSAAGFAARRQLLGGSSGVA